MIEHCDNFQGIILNHNLQGGTSGFFVHMQNRLFGENVITKKPVINNLLFPSQHTGNSVLEIYNYTLGLKNMLEYSDLAILFDN